MATSKEAYPAGGHTAKLCTRCRGLELLGTENFRALYFEEEWPVLSGLKQSAAAGCEFCSMVCADIISGGPPRPPSRGPGGSRVKIIIRPDYTDRNEGLYALRVFFLYSEIFSEHLRRRSLENPKDPRLEILNIACYSYLLCMNSYEATSFCKLRLCTPTTKVLSERNIGFLQKCMAECIAPSEAAALNFPTRLLDLAELQWGRAKLVVWARAHMPLGEKVKYAALSYCWGDADTAKFQSITTLSNLQERESGFEIGDLSPVIRDAIQVCSCLNIRYLWVDALCILQAGTLPHGSSGQEAARKDWEHESELLGETFRGAHITICAASSTSCQDSFLQDRHIQPGIVINLRTEESCERSASPVSPRKSTACEIIPWPTTAVEYGPGLWHGNVRGRAPFLANILNSRWYSRGWVHQEIAFSKRLLIFDDTTVCFQSGKLHAYDNGWSDNKGNSTTWRLREFDIEKLRLSPFESFAREVKAFYAKEFTHKTDCLPAIAALASHVARLTESQYLAGLWRDNLENDLLFSIEPNRGEMPFEERRRELSDPQSNARPSWSWAGHRGSFKHLGGNNKAWLERRNPMTLDCVVLEAVAEPDGRSPFGAISHAHLSLRCRVVALKELLSDEFLAADPPPWRQVLTSGYSSSSHGLKICWDTNNDAVSTSLAEDVSLICVSVDHRNFVAGLVVIPTDDGKHYYRIGMWEKYLESSCVDNHRQWKSQDFVLV